MKLEVILYHVSIAYSPPAPTPCRSSSVLFVRRVDAQAFKKLDVYTAPDVLIVVLKRFLFSPGSSMVYRQKLDTHVSFPVTGLDLTRCLLAAACASDRASAVSTRIRTTALHSALGQNVFWRILSWFLRAGLQACVSLPAFDTASNSSPEVFVVEVEANNRGYVYICILYSADTSSSNSLLLQQYRCR